MSRSRKLLLVGGLLLAIWGMSYGLWYAVFAEHQALDNIGSSLSASFAKAAERNPAASQAALQAYSAAQYVYLRQVDAHSHWIGLAMLLIVLGIAFDRIPYGESRRFWLALALLLGSFIFPLGVLLENPGHAAMGRALAMAGSGLIVFSLAVIAAGFVWARADD